MNAGIASPSHLSLDTLMRPWPGTEMVWKGAQPGGRKVQWAFSAFQFSRLGQKE